LKISYVPARRAINSRATSRGVVNEVIISNVQKLANIELRMAKAHGTRRQSKSKIA
jgi:hypothetical protein